MQHASNHAFHPDPDSPLAESITPLGDGNRAVLCQLYPEGNLTALGYLDQDGEFIGTSGSFRAYRINIVNSEEKINHD